jgi:hypothetical protein
MNVERRPDRLAATDRTVVAVSGVLALAAAVGLMAAHRGWWDLRRPGEPVLAPPLDQSWGANPERWAIVATVAALLVVLAVIWIVQRLGRARPRADVAQRLDVPATAVVDLRDGAQHVCLPGRRCRCSSTCRPRRSSVWPKCWRSPTGTYGPRAPISLQQTEDDGRLRSPSSFPPGCPCRRCRSDSTTRSCLRCSGAWAWPTSVSTCGTRCRTANRSGHREKPRVSEPRVSEPPSVSEPRVSEPPVWEGTGMSDARSGEDADELAREHRTEDRLGHEATEREPRRRRPAGGQGLEQPDPMAPGNSVNDDELGVTEDAVEPNEPA